MRHASVRRTTVLALSAALAALAVAACGDDNGTLPFPVRSYVLQTIGGQPLPYVTQADPSGDTTSILGETIALDPRGRVTTTSVYRTVVQGGAPTVNTTTAKLIYNLNGTQITIDPLCPPDANCIGGSTGTLTSTTLTLVSRIDPSAPARVYSRTLPD